MGSENGSFLLDQTQKCNACIHPRVDILFT